MRIAVTTRGLDLFHGNILSDITKLKDAGILYVFLKSFEVYEDPTFQVRWAETKAAGLIRGAYAYFHPNRDPVEQANAFLATANFEPGDLPPVLDIETLDGVSPIMVRENCFLRLQHVQAMTKRRPIIYSSPYFLTALGLDKRFLDFGLWIADYRGGRPRLPWPWTDWTFWQTSSSGAIPGVNGLADTDVFNGSLADLQAFIAKSRLD